MKPSFFLAVVVSSLIFFSMTIYAGNRPGALTISVNGGKEYFSSKRNMENTGVGILEVGYDFNEHWGIEGMYGWFNTDFNRSQQDTRRINGTLFALNGVYHYPINPIVEPYLLAGPGVTGINPNLFDANNEGNMNAAIGTQLFIHQAIAFRFELRDVYTFVGGKNDVLLTAGMSFLFDFC